MEENLWHQTCKNSCKYSYKYSCKYENKWIKHLTQGVKKDTDATKKPAGNNRDKSKKSIKFKSNKINWFKTSGACHFHLPIK